MHSSYLRKVIRSAGAGGFMGRGIRLFDHEYHVPHFAWLNERIKIAMHLLAAKGFDPSAFYRDNGADCDNWAMWVQSEVTQMWAIDHRSEVEIPALAFGRAALPGHEINVGVCVEGIKAWDYGQPVEIDPKTIKEIELK